MKGPRLAGALSFMALGVCLVVLLISFGRMRAVSLMKVAGPEDVNIHLRASSNSIAWMCGGKEVADVCLLSAETCVAVRKAAITIYFAVWPLLCHGSCSVLFLLRDNCEISLPCLRATDTMLCCSRCRKRSITQLLRAYQGTCIRLLPSMLPHLHALPSSWTMCGYMHLYSLPVLRRDVATCSCFQNNGCSGEDPPCAIVSYCALSPQHDAIFPQSFLARIPGLSRSDDIPAGSFVQHCYDEHIGGIRFYLGLRAGQLECICVLHFLALRDVWGRIRHGLSRCILSFRDSWQLLQVRSWGSSTVKGDESRNIRVRSTRWSAHDAGKEGLTIISLVFAAGSDSARIAVLRKKFVSFQGRTSVSFLEFAAKPCHPDCLLLSADGIFRKIFCSPASHVQLSGVGSITSWSNALSPWIETAFFLTLMVIQ